MLAIKKRDRISGTTRGAGHEDGPKLTLEAIFDSLLAGEQGAEHRRGTSPEGFLIGNQDKIPRLLRVFRSIEQVGLRCEGQPLQILQGMDRVGFNAALLKHLAVVRG